MRVIADSKKLKPLCRAGEWVCPKCGKILEKKAKTCFGFDLICPKGHYRAGVFQG